MVNGIFWVIIIIVFFLFLCLLLAYGAKVYGYSSTVSQQVAARPCVSVGPTYDAHAASAHAASMGFGGYGHDHAFVQKIHIDASPSQATSTVHSVHPDHRQTFSTARHDNNHPHTFYNASNSPYANTHPGYDSRFAPSTQSWMAPRPAWTAPTPTLGSVSGFPSSGAPNTAAPVSGAQLSPVSAPSPAPAPGTSGGPYSSPYVGRDFRG